MNFDDLDSQKDDFIYEYIREHGEDVSDEEIEMAWQRMLDEQFEVESEIGIWTSMGK